jgi:hypothetical protein
MNAPLTGAHSFFYNIRKQSWQSIYVLYVTPFYDEEKEGVKWEDYIKVEIVWGYT